MAANGDTNLGIGVGVGCLSGVGVSIFLIILFLTNVLGSMGLGPDSAGASTFTQSGNLSTKVPPNFAALFKEASAKFDVDPAVIAGIYLTEHHTDSFGKDIPSLDAMQSGCSSNSSGARGPMQIIDETWSGVATKLKASGISNPDRCKYRDAIWGGAIVIRGKFTSQSDAKAACGITKSNGTPNYSDDCIRKIGRAYCGACTGRACGTRGYNYCDQALRHYKIAAGSISYIPSLFIPSSKERLCLATNTK